MPDTCPHGLWDLSTGCVDACSVLVIRYRYSSFDYSINTYWIQFNKYKKAPRLFRTIRIRLILIGLETPRESKYTI